MPAVRFGVQQFRDFQEYLEDQLDYDSFKWSEEWYEQMAHKDERAHLLFLY